MRREPLLIAKLIDRRFRGTPEPTRQRVPFGSFPSPPSTFWHSPLLRLEVMLHPTHHRDKLEMAFHGEYFKHGNCYGDLDRVFEIGAPEAMKHGIPVMDALHIAAANLARCEILLTTESLTKPIFRTKFFVAVVTIADRPPNPKTHRTTVSCVDWCHRPRSATLFLLGSYPTHHFESDWISCLLPS